jgi:ribosome-binding protein aMBF1 (putative translation factor)
MPKAINPLQIGRITMDKQKQLNLEKRGYRVGSAADFLGLTPEEEAYIEIRLEISTLIRYQRKKLGWTQTQLARSLGSSQSRVAKMEAGEPSTSLDLMLKGLLRLGISKHELGDLLTGKLQVDMEPV